MKIILIRYKEKTKNTRIISKVQKRAGTVPHLGLAYIQTALKKHGHESNIIDAEALALTENQLYEKLKKYSPELVGVTTTTPGLSGSFKACEIAKRTGAKVILGGPHTEIFGKENLVHPFIDYIGIGEGCTIMPRLADALKSNQKERLINKIPGLVSRDFDNGYAPMINLEKIGWPDREPEINSDYNTVLARKPFTTMISSRGCPFKCSFCYKQRVDRNILLRSATDIVEEMSFLVNKYKIREILFYDDVFTVNRRRVYEICQQIIDRNLKVSWEAPTRADLVDMEMLKIMKSAGCIRLRFGIESGNKDILHKMNKSSNLGIMEKAVKMTRKAGIQTFGYFIVGYLDETLEQYHDTVNFARRLPLNFASFYVATPLPGTQLHVDAVNTKRFPKDFWAQYVAGKMNFKRANLLDPMAEKKAKDAFCQFYFRLKMIPMIAKKLLTAHSCIPVATGLTSLAYEKYFKLNK